MWLLDLAVVLVKLAVLLAAIVVGMYLLMKHLSAMLVVLLVFAFVVAPILDKASS